MIDENDPRADWSEARIATFSMDVQQLLGDQRVQFLLWYIFALCGIYRTSLNADVATFIEGERNVGLKLINFLAEFNPEIYPAISILGIRAAAHDKAAKEAARREAENREGEQS